MPKKTQVRFMVGPAAAKALRLAHTKGVKRLTRREFDAVLKEGKFLVAIELGDMERRAADREPKAVYSRCLDMFDSGNLYPRTQTSKAGSISRRPKA